MTDDSSWTEALYPAARILLVDGDPERRDRLEADLRAMGHAPLPFPTGEAALEALLGHVAADLVIAAALLPGPLDGTALARTLKSSPAWKDVPVLLVAEGGGSECARALDSGADDVVPPWPESAELRARIDRRLAAGDRLRAAVDERAAAALARAADAEEALGEALGVLATACEEPFGDGGGHALRTGLFAQALGEELGLEASFCRDLGFAARLHDVGKVRVPRALLDKEGPLTVAEFEVVKNHAAWGAELLGAHPRLALAREVAAGHHERWDGTGYPTGAVGARIPLGARIAAVCDVYESLRLRRPYRAPLSHEAAVAIITRGDWRTSPEHFDPEVLAAFRRVEGRLRGLHDEFKGKG